MPRTIRDGAPRYHRRRCRPRPPPDPTRRLPRPLRLAPRAGADRLSATRRTSRAALERARRDDLGGRPRLPVRPGRASGDGRPRPATTTLRRAFFGEPAAARRRRPGRPDDLARRSSPSSPTASPAMQMNASTRASSATSRRRRCRCRSSASCSPRSTNQGVDVWHAGPARRVRRGGGRPLAVRPRRLRRRASSGC